MRKKVTAITKAAKKASYQYPGKYIYYFCRGNNECYIIGGNSAEALKKSGFVNYTNLAHWRYLNGVIC